MLDKHELTGIALGHISGLRPTIDTKGKRFIFSCGRNAADTLLWNLQDYLMGGVGVRFNTTQEYTTVTRSVQVGQVFESRWTDDKDWYPVYEEHEERVPAGESHHVVFNKTDRTPRVELVDGKLCVPFSTLKEDVVEKVIQSALEKGGKQETKDVLKAFFGDEAADALVTTFAELVKIKNPTPEDLAAHPDVARDFSGAVNVATRRIQAKILETGMPAIFGEKATHRVRKILAESKYTLLKAVC